MICCFPPIQNPQRQRSFSVPGPLLGGYDEENSRTAMHKALAGYHRMFFERNIPVEILSSRELAGTESAEI